MVVKSSFKVKNSVLERVKPLSEAWTTNSVTSVDAQSVKWVDLIFETLDALISDFLAERDIQEAQSLGQAGDVRHDFVVDGVCATRELNVRESLVMIKHEIAS